LTPPPENRTDDIIPVVDGAAGKLKGERLEICRGNRGGKGKLVRAGRK
jgi:topoisomerase-4 subunit A